MGLHTKDFQSEFSQCNRFVERAIQIIMKILQKNREDNSDPYLAMLALPTTQNSSDTSALEFLMKKCCEH